MSDSLLTILEMVEEVLGEELLAKNWQDMFDEPILVKPPMDEFAQQVFKILKPESNPTDFLTSEDFEVLNAELDSEGEQIAAAAYKKALELAKFLDQGLKQDNKMKKDLVDTLFQQKFLLQ